MTACIMIRRYYPVDYSDIIYECAKEYDLKPEFIYAVIHTESKFQENAVSHRDARGLMQIIDSTADWLAQEMHLEDFQTDMIFNPEINIRMGSHYLHILESRYGDTDTALCAYNAGSGNVDSWLMNPAYSIDGRTLQTIPFSETREYVKRVSKNQKIYRILLKIYEVIG